MNNEDKLEALRKAAREAADAGYYADYLVAVVNTVLIRGNYPRNPDESDR